MMRRKVAAGVDKLTDIINDEVIAAGGAAEAWGNVPSAVPADDGDRKSTRLNSSHAT